MERFFIVNNKDLADKVKHYEYMRNSINETFREFAQENGIETVGYYQVVDQLMINPTDGDKAKFGTQMKVDERTFKKNSVMNKKWVALCKEKGLTNPDKPSWELASLIGGHTRFRSRLFSIDEVVYGSFEVDCTFELPAEHFTELKASEFFKIVEER